MIWRNAKTIQRLNDNGDESESSSGNVALIIALAALVVCALLFQAVTS